ncbi:UDP-3-O-(3-hydroxymyristoyl)glucosamine N-acyltransferase, partial [bacterium]|nr:UDP-3-O-(3-hydroxymyristoyl)glucosamine N-acyltransferase [bacterium]
SSVPVQHGFRIDEIVKRLGGEFEGDGAVVVNQVGSLASAKTGQIAFLANPKFRQQLNSTQATAVILSPQFSSEAQIPRIIHPNPYAYYARVVALLNPGIRPAEGIHSSAIVQSEIPASASIGAHVAVGERVSIGENVIIFPGCVIG